MNLDRTRNIKYARNKAGTVFWLPTVDYHVSPVHRQEELSTRFRPHVILSSEAATTLGFKVPFGFRLVAPLTMSYRKEPGLRPIPITTHKGRSKKQGWMYLDDVKVIPNKMLEACEYAANVDMTMVQTLIAFAHAEEQG